MPDEDPIRGRIEAPAPTMRELAMVLFRQRRVFVWMSAIVFGAAVLYALVGANYKAEMKILVRRGRADSPVSAGENAPLDLTRMAVTEEELNSEVELLRDEEVLRKVVEQTGVGRKDWLAWLRFGETNDTQVERAVRRLAKRLKVDLVKKTNLIGVSFGASDPQVAAKVLRAVANVYLEKHTQVHRPSGELRFYEQQTVESRRQLEDSKRKLLQFAKGHGVVAAAQQRDLALGKLSEVDASARQTRIELAATRERVAQLGIQLAQLPERTVTQKRTADNPELLKALKASLLDLELKRTELLMKYEPSHRLVKEVEDQVAQAQMAIAAENLTPVRDETTDKNPQYEWAKSELERAQVDLKTLEVREEATRNQEAAYRGVSEKFGVAAACQRIQGKSFVSAQHVFGTAGGTRDLGAGDVSVADVGTVETAPRPDSCRGRAGISECWPSSPVAGAVARLLDQRGGRGDELSVRERLAIHPCRDVSRTGTSRGEGASMLTVAYLANLLPSAVEPYVLEEIEELRKRGVRVVAGSVRRPLTGSGELDPQIVLQRWNLAVLASAAVLCVRKWNLLAPLLKRVLSAGGEGLAQRVKALVHTFLGACYARLLEGRGVEHIHVHHGYFGSWIAMTAARLMGVPFSMTLHGSDLLLHGAYLDIKLAHCAFCLTISEYNRNYILQRYPGIDPGKVRVSRLGVDVCEEVHATGPPSRAGDSFRILTVGRLHAVKDHAFLVRACVELAARALDFQCDIAGDGPERKRLEGLISRCGLSDRVRLLGHVRHDETNALYDRADLIVITSRSEGIPLVLMEAMARGKIVLAPAITGIPELISAGDTGFLYEPGSMRNFVGQVLMIHSLGQPPSPEKLVTKEKLVEKIDRRCCSPPADSTEGTLEKVRRAAREQVRRKFNRSINLERFAETFIERVKAGSERSADENPVLQQVQLSLQRDGSLPV